MKKASAMKPGSGGKVQNAKAQAFTKQAYGKATMNPAKKPGVSGDNPKPRKGSPLAAKKKK